ncbi:RNA methyltransferase [Alsobacter sp. SYSU M60028]|uniref:RNA methyltransferase n=1 Tax=Alsobacter ponti TaxID=2962936 RepID=A0ABT1LFZ0_9HYPH|nr:RNA methyltransferase [Alsobacter ponti]MCP8940417.1 RNA methyltransferase [Alsobacter ponti]
MPGAGTDHTRPPIGGGPAVILVEPQLGENIGMAARAMANFGLDDMRLVRPRERWLHAKTRAAAAGAEYILDKATTYDTVRDAVASLSFVYATTARERGQGKIVVGPREAGAAMQARVAAGQSVGVLFGRERTGLENDDIALADEILTYPVNPAYASLNLSQAVLLLGFAWRDAAEAPLPFAFKPKWPPAPREMVLSFFDYLEEQLDARGFFRPAGKRPVMARNLRNMFHRMNLSEQDVRTLRGMVVRLIEGPREPQTRKRTGPKQTPKGARSQDLMRRDDGE